jgi:hypothetical protein
MALAAVGKQDAALIKVVTYLRAHVADYSDPDGKVAGFPGPFSGSAAKLAVLAEITGQDPTAFGGFDLLKTLTGHVCASANGTTCTAAGDFSNAFSGVSQALGVLALARSKVTPPAATVTRLEQLQCPDGGFSSDLIAPGSACTSDADTTGYAVQALVLVPAARGAVDKAAQFLLDAQQADGGYLGASAENTQSAALAAQGLLAASAKTGHLAAASTPADAVRAVLAWIARAQTAGGGLGIHIGAPGDAVATAQALPPLAGATLTTLRHAVKLPGSGGRPAPSGSGSPSPGSTGPGSSSPTGGGESLASTGSDVRATLVWAAVLLAAGLILVGAGTRRTLLRRRR